MAIAVPIVDQEITVSDFGKPVVDGINANTDLLNKRVVAEVFSTASLPNTQPAGGYVDIAVSVTFTAVAGQRYRISFGANVNGNTTGSFIALVVRKSDNTNIMQAAVGLSTFASYGHTLSGVGFAMKSNANKVFSGSTTLKLSVSCAGGTWGLDGAGSPSYIVVEHIGPDT